MKTKTKTKKQINSELKSRPEQLSTDTQSTASQPAPQSAQPQPETPVKTQRKPYVDFKKREQNRQLPTERVLALLRRWLPRQYEIAEVIGQWVWIQFTETPAEPIRAELSQLGFHWNPKRKAWQHPCGRVTEGSPKDPRERYASYFPADAQAAS
jgi:hypothetical protein